MFLYYDWVVIAVRGTRWLNFTVFNVIHFASIPIVTAGPVVQLGCHLLRKQKETLMLSWLHPQAAAGQPAAFHPCYPASSNQMMMPTRGSACPRLCDLDSQSRFAGSEAKPHTAISIWCNSERIRGRKLNVIQRLFEYDVQMRWTECMANIPPVSCSVAAMSLYAR